MNTYTLSHLSDDTLLRNLASLLAQDRQTTASMLAHIAEVDAHKLYLPAACPSMFDYCVQVLGFSEDEACKRIRVARTGRDVPGVLEAIADGRLTLSTASLLAPHLNPDSAPRLLAAAAGRCFREVRALLAEEHPRTDAFSWTVPVQAQGTVAPEVLPPPQPELSSVAQRISGVAYEDRVATVRPLSSRSYALQCTLSEATQAKLLRAQQLMHHRLPSGDIPEVLDAALDALLEQLERQKFAATSRPRAARKPVREGGRHIPSAVKRAVWKRDGGRCAYINDEGRRCAARAHLEFDHVQPFARGGEATIGNTRLLCRAHNQHAAESVYGEGFMRGKREARRAAQGPVKPLPDLEVVPYLRALGLRADEARAAATGAGLEGDSLEARVRAALASLQRGRAFPGATRVVIRPGAD